MHIQSFREPEVSVYVFVFARKKGTCLDDLPHHGHGTSAESARLEILFAHHRPRCAGRRQAWTVQAEDKLGLGLRSRRDL